MSALAQLDQPGRLWTAEDLEMLDLDDRRRFEIIDGALLVSPSPTPDHELISEELRAAVRAALPEGMKIVGPMKVDLGRSVPVPDLMAADLSTLRGGSRLRPADIHLAAEIMSPSSVSADRILKAALYAAAGIAHFWRVETDPLLLAAYTLDGDAYRQVGVWRAGETARLAAPFVIEIDVAQLLPDA